MPSFNIGDGVPTTPRIPPYFWFYDKGTIMDLIFSNMSNKEIASSLLLLFLVIAIPVFFLFYHKKVKEKEEQKYRKQLKVEPQKHTSHVKSVKPSNSVKTTTSGSHTSTTIDNPALDAAFINVALLNHAYIANDTTEQKPDQHSHTPNAAAEAHSYHATPSSSVSKSTSSDYQSGGYDYNSSPSTSTSSDSSTSFSSFD